MKNLRKWICIFDQSKNINFIFYYYTVAPGFAFQHFKDVLTLSKVLLKNPV
ncbi:hypothetical protein [Mycoplasmopsis canis]|uniref:hypothetical protein n=1 Tax=Mycoplasmopsis canis TaxID=29555 RepID=UPI000AAD0196|nr:hypothetical protein [Mycoplasmopsis canis]